MKRMLIPASWLIAALAAPLASHAADDAPERVRALLSHTYDRPGHRVEAFPIVVEGDYALADWVQGEMAGRALLRRDREQWTIVACGGDAFKDLVQLRDAGLPSATAKRLVARLEQAEHAIDPVRVKRFDAFGKTTGPMGDARPARAGS